MTNLVEFQDVNYIYPAAKDGVEALSGVTGAIPRGAIYGLLGPNGAGKTTFIRCITGFIRPGRGSVRVFGAPPCRRTLGSMGVLIENPGTYRKMSGAEYLRFFAGLYGLADVEGKIRELAGLFGCEDLSVPVSKMSAGNRQRVQLMRSLLHQPALVLWDEPFSNLDPQTQKKSLGILSRYVKERCATALVATHQLEQAEALCSHYGFLKEGRLVFSGEKVLANRLAGDDSRTAFTLARPAQEGVIAALAVECGASLSFPEDTRGVSGASAKEAVSSIREFLLTGSRNEQTVPVFLSALCRQGISIQSVVPQRKNLYEIFSGIVG